MEAPNRNDVVPFGSELVDNPDPYALIAAQWRTRESSENQRIQEASLDLIDLLMARAKEKDCPLKELREISKEVARLSGSHTLKQNNNFKLGAMNRKPEKKASNGNRPPTNAVQMNNCNVVVQPSTVEPSKP